MSGSTPNGGGPIPEPVTSVRSPQTAPEPKLNCISDTPFQNSVLGLNQEPLQNLFGGMGDIPSLGIAGDCRAREMVVPPAFDQLVDRTGSAPRCGGASLDIRGKNQVSLGIFANHRDPPTSRIHHRGKN